MRAAFPLLSGPRPPSWSQNMGWRCWDSLVFGGGWLQAATEVLPQGFSAFASHRTGADLCF